MPNFRYRNIERVFALHTLASAYFLTRILNYVFRVRHRLSWSYRLDFSCISIVPNSIPISVSYRYSSLVLDILRTHKKNMIPGIISYYIFMLFKVSPKTWMYYTVVARCLKGLATLLWRGLRICSASKGREIASWFCRRLNTATLLQINSISLKHRRVNSLHNSFLPATGQRWPALLILLPTSYY